MRFSICFFAGMFLILWSFVSFAKTTMSEYKLCVTNVMINNTYEDYNKSEFYVVVGNSIGYIFNKGIKYTPCFYAERLPIILMVKEKDYCVGGSWCNGRWDDDLKYKGKNKKKIFRKLGKYPSLNFKDRKDEVQFDVTIERRCSLDFNEHLDKVKQYVNRANYFTWLKGTLNISGETTNSLVKLNKQSCEKNKLNNLRFVEKNQAENEYIFKPETYQIPDSEKFELYKQNKTRTVHSNTVPKPVIDYMKSLERQKISIIGKDSVNEVRSIVYIPSLKEATEGNPFDTKALKPSYALNDFDDTGLKGINLSISYDFLPVLSFVGKIKDNKITWEAPKGVYPKAIKLTADNNAIALFNIECNEVNKACTFSRNNSKVRLRFSEHSVKHFYASDIESTLKLLTSAFVKKETVTIKPPYFKSFEAVPTVIENQLSIDLSLNGQPLFATISLLDKNGDSIDTKNWKIGSSTQSMTIYNNQVVPIYRLASLKSDDGKDQKIKDQKITVFPSADTADSLFYEHTQSDEISFDDLATWSKDQGISFNIPLKKIRLAAVDFQNIAQKVIFIKQDDESIVLFPFSSRPQNNTYSLKSLENAFVQLIRTRRFDGTYLDKNKLGLLYERKIENIFTMIPEKKGVDVIITDKKIKPRSAYFAVKFSQPNSPSFNHIRRLTPSPHHEDKNLPSAFELSFSKSEINLNKILLYDAYNDEGICVRQRRQLLDNHTLIEFDHKKICSVHNVHENKTQQSEPMPPKPISHSQIASSTKASSDLTTQIKSHHIHWIFTTKSINRDRIYKPLTKHLIKINKSIRYLYDKKVEEGIDIFTVSFYIFNAKELHKFFEIADKENFKSFKKLDGILETVISFDIPDAESANSVNDLLTQISNTVIPDETEQHEFIVFLKTSKFGDVTDHYNTLQSELNIKKFTIVNLKDSIPSGYSIKIKKYSDWKKNPGL